MLHTKGYYPEVGYDRDLGRRPQARRSTSNHDSTTTSYPIAIKVEMLQLYMT
jgi:hypothetical protein